MKPSTGLAVLLCFAVAAAVTTSVKAADRKALYGKAEDIIHNTDDVKASAR